jgi:hypothetical protein
VAGRPAAGLGGRFRLGRRRHVARQHRESDGRQAHPQGRRDAGRWHQRRPVRYDRDAVRTSRPRRRRRPDHEPRVRSGSGRGEAFARLGLGSRPRPGGRRAELRRRERGAERAVDRGGVALRAWGGDRPGGTPRRRPPGAGLRFGGERRWLTRDPTSRQRRLARVRRRRRRVRWVIRRERPEWVGGVGRRERAPGRRGRKLGGSPYPRATHSIRSAAVVVPGWERRRVDIDRRRSARFGSLTSRSIAPDSSSASNA